MTYITIPALMRLPHGVIQVLSLIHILWCPVNRTQYDPYLSVKRILERVCFKQKLIPITLYPGFGVAKWQKYIQLIPSLALFSRDIHTLQLMGCLLYTSRCV